MFPPPLRSPLRKEASMAARTIDVTNEQDLGSVVSSLSGTVIGDVRVTYDDADNLGDILVALDVAKSKIVEELE